MKITFFYFYNNTGDKITIFNEHEYTISLVISCYKLYIVTN